MKIGDILNFRNFDSFYGKIIRFRNRLVWHEDGFSHSAIIVDVKDDLVTLAEAIHSGFTISDYGKKTIEEWEKTGFLTIGTPKLKLINVQENAKKYEGRPYAWFDIFAILISTFLGSKGLKYVTGSKALICSEAVARILYDSSDKVILLGYDEPEQKEDSEFKIKYDLIEPTHIAKSKWIDWKNE